MELDVDIELPLAGNFLPQKENLLIGWVCRDVFYEEAKNG